ncbi:MAG: tetratricopeptide repeat protein [Elusimicrobia bacterium]|nr:tetratricopeptide repeat protein [Elusimicrobiota bacterium]
MTLLFAAVVAANLSTWSATIDIRKSLDRARRLSWEKRYDESIAAYRSILDAYPAARVELAEVLGWAGRHAEALETYDRFLATNNDHPRAFRERAELLGWMGNKEESARLLRAILQRRPDDRRAMLALGDLHSWAGDLRTSRAHYARALERWPADPEILGRMERVNRARRPSVGGVPGYFSSSRGLERLSLLSEMEVPAADNLNVALSFIQWEYRHRAGASIRARSWGTALAYQAGMPWTLEAPGPRNSIRARRLGGDLGRPRSQVDRPQRRAFHGLWQARGLRRRAARGDRVFRRGERGRHREPGEA